MKFQNNWRQKSLENLEKDNWGDMPLDDSSIVQRIYRLRKVPLEEFSHEDIRFMIIQEVGLPHLLTLAAELLTNNLYAEGDYYEGDILAAVLKIKSENWKGSEEIWSDINRLIIDREVELRAFRPKLDIENFKKCTF